MSDLKTLTLGGKTYDSFPDTKARERLSNVEYQPVTTETAYEHKDLPEIEKTVSFETDGVFGDTAYINYGVDLLPRGGFNRTFPWNGLTITQKGDTFKLTGQITANATVVLTKDGSNNRYVELPDGLIGKTVKLLGFTDLLLDKMIVNLYFYDAEKVQLEKKVSYLAKTNTKLEADIVIPDNTVYYAVELYSGVTDFELNHQTKLYLLVANEFEEVSLTESTTKDNIKISAFSTLPYKSFVQYKVSLNEFISKFAGGGTVSCLTPEDFGAKGDGETDDSEAIALCLEEASITKQTVLMAKKYYISTPINISQNGLNIMANDIVYDGTDTAIKINGSQNTINIHSIVSNATGISFEGSEVVKNVICNYININTIQAKKHGIIFVCNPINVFQNVIHFNYIRAGGADCYGIAYMNNREDGKFITENNFYGGHITNCEWAVYKCSGNSRFYSIQVEGEVQGGFYIEGMVTIFCPRTAEAQRDGNLPLYKFTAVEGVRIYNTSHTHINQFDLSEVTDTFTAPSGHIYSMLEGHIGVIDGSIIATLLTDGENSSQTTVYTNKAYMWGKHLIFTPHLPFKKVVTTETLDTRLIGTETSYAEVRNLTQLPTKFVVDNINTEIYLHSSYCVFGYNEFEVIQANGFTCKIYDVNSTLIFDGTTQGDGLYKFNVYKDSELCVTQSFSQIRCDFLGHHWQILKLGATVI